MLGGIGRKFLVDPHMSYLSEPHFQNEKAAFAFVEAHLWKDGRACPHCGVVDDKARTGKAVLGVVGKRLTYRAIKDGKSN